jgi:hypothetical protein
MDGRSQYDLRRETPFPRRSQMPACCAHSRTTACRAIALTLKAGPTPYFAVEGLSDRAPAACISEDRILWCEAKPDPPRGLQPQRCEDHMLHDRVDVSVRPFYRTVNIKRGGAGRLIHGPHHGF